MNEGLLEEQRKMVLGYFDLSARSYIHGHSPLVLPHLPFRTEFSRSNDTGIPPKNPRHLPCRQKTTRRDPTNTTNRCERKAVFSTCTSHVKPVQYIEAPDAQERIISGPKDTAEKKNDEDYRDSIFIVIVEDFPTSMIRCSMQRKGCGI